MKEEIDSHGTSLIVQSLIHDDGRMCRQSFNTLERASKLWEALKCKQLVFLHQIIHPQLGSATFHLHQKGADYYQIQQESLSCNHLK